MKVFIFILICFCAITSSAQVGIKTDNPQALLHIKPSNPSLPTDGILIPRMTEFPLTDPGEEQDGMLVFITGELTIEEGFYYWDWEGASGEWRKSNTGSLDDAYDYAGRGNGREIIADKGAVLISGGDGLEVTGTFGSGLPTQLSGNGTRMFFNPLKSSFRSGTITSGNGFDDINIGDHSFSHGLNNTASGEISIAMGKNNNASAEGAVAIGADNISSGVNSFTAGVLNQVTAVNAVAFGENNRISQENSVGFGFANQVSGFESLASGERNIVSANAAGGFGYENNVSGFSSYVFGRNNTVSSNVSFVAGAYNKANHFRNIVLGDNLETDNNVQIILGRMNLTGQSLNSRSIFVLGNGSGAVGRSNAVMVLENGNMGLDNTVPDDAVLQMNTSKDRGIDININSDLSGGIYGTYQKINSTSPQNNNMYGTFSELNKSESTSSNMRGIYSSIVDEQTGGGVRNLYAGQFVISSSHTNGTSRAYAIYGDATSAAPANVEYAGYFAGDLTVTGTFSSPSDQHLKTSIQTYSGSLDKLNQLKVYEYYFKKDYQQLMGVPKAKQIGFISQQVEEILPELTQDEVHPIDNDDGKDESIAYKSVNYLGVVPLTVQAIQELSSENIMLKKDNTELKQRLRSIEVRLLQLEKISSSPKE